MDRTIALDRDGFLDIGVRSCGGATCQIGEDFQIRFACSRRDRQPRS